MVCQDNMRENVNAKVTDDWFIMEDKCGKTGFHTAV